MAGHNHIEADSDLKWLQFLANQEMQTLLSVNLFANGSMEDNSSTSSFALPTKSPQQTTHIGGSQIFGDANVNFAGDLQNCLVAGQNVPQQNYSAMASCSNYNFARLEPITCVLPSFLSDLAFAEQAAKYSSFAEEYCIIPEGSASSTAETVTSGKSKAKAIEFVLSRNDVKHSRLKKRKAVQKEAISDPLERKRLKSLKVKAKPRNNDNCVEKTEEENNAKTFPATIEKQNYVYVRARRGEATDRHSLAERVRREKISERMKLLQDMVPGCNKITGKELMLDEIINHVLSLQHQVEFLSMKLATLDPCFDIDINSYLR